MALAPFLFRRRRCGFQPGLDEGVLRVEMREVGDQILDHRHMRQRIDFHIALAVIDILGAGERIETVDIHGAGAANPLAAGAAEGQRLIDLVLDLDERIENHRPASVEIDFIGVDARVCRVVGRPAIDAEAFDIFRIRRGLEGLAFAHCRIFRQRELNHDRTLVRVSTRVLSA